MYPASAALKAAIKTDHVVVAKAELWNQDSKIMDLNIDSGSVKVNVGSSVRRTCDITVITDRTNTNLVPSNGFDPLTPFGNELKLFRGVQFPDGTQEYVPLGVFVMTDVAIKDSNEGVEIAISGEDRSIRVSRNKWTQPYQMIQGTLEASLTALLQDRWNDILVSFPTTNVTINQVILGTDSNNDAWRDAVALAELVGYDLFFDVDGVCTMKQFPSLDSSIVVATYEEGTTTITDLERSMSTKETYNGVIYSVEGSQVSAPIRVEVWDEDTSSPTYRYGVFGEAPTFINTSLLTTESEAIKAATLLLNTYIGAQEKINWNALVDPTLDANDVVYIRSTGAKVDRLVIIDSLDIPLSADNSLSGEARMVRVVNANEIIAVGA